MLKAIIVAGLALGLGAGAGWADAGGAGPSSSDMGRFESAPKVTIADINAAYADGVKAVEAADWKTAVTKFKFVTRNAAKNADGWNYLGYSSRRSGDAKAGEAAYKRALRLDPNHPRANEYYGELLVRLHRLPEAQARLAVLNACCSADPGSAKLASLIADAKAGKDVVVDDVTLDY